MSKEAIYYVSEPKEVDVPVKKYMCMVKYVDSDGNYKTKTIHLRRSITNSKHIRYQKQGNSLKERNRKVPKNKL